MSHPKSEHEQRVARRQFLKLVVALAAVGPSWIKARSRLPTEVAGIAIPQTPLSLASVAFSQHACPDFLFNHCMRTFLFGALHARHHGQDYGAEPALVAATLHDLGLLDAHETIGQSFEVDSADIAEKFAVDNGASAKEAHLIWNATVMHDMRWAIVSRQDPAIQLVAAGAGADVVGPDPNMISPEAIKEILIAFPRLGFKRNFQDLLDAHCRRKPLSQVGTWLEGYCRAVAPPGVHAPSTAAMINAAPFAD